jgi:hypothetical protein
MRREKSIRHTPSAIAAYATASPRDAPRVEGEDLAECFSRRRSALATATETSGSAARRRRAAALFENIPIPGAASTRDARAPVSPPAPAAFFEVRCLRENVAYVVVENFFEENCAAYV